MITRVLYIDDEISERVTQRIKSSLEVPDEFKVKLELPPKRLPGLTELPDALLVDLDLTTAVIDDETINYFGSTLAAEIRMRHPACPIILITKPNILTEYKSQIQMLEDSIDVDLILDKDEVIKNPEETRVQITSLATGFQALDSIGQDDWQAVLDLMQADSEEAALLREAASPAKDWTIPQTSRWIRRVVMGYPGILYDELTAATRLGIDVTAFRDPAVQEIFKSAKYKGIFHDHGKRWWRNRLFRIAQELILQHNLKGPVHLVFGKAFQQEYGIQLAPSICVYDKRPVANWVCYVLKKPVKLQHSVPYYPDSRPDVMDQARVSFTAIKEEAEFDERLVDADSYNLVVKELWEIE